MPPESGSLSWDEALALSRRTIVKYSLSDEQKSYLYRCCLEVPKGGTVVELGVCSGSTSVIMAYVAKHVGYAYHGVDNFVLGDAIGEQGYHRLMRSLDLPYTLHRGLTNEVPWSAPIDLLLIDASHTDPFVAQDCDRWLPFVKPKGVAMFHDYDGAPEPLSAHWPVRRAVDRTTETWLMRYYLDGLMIKERPHPVTYDVRVDDPRNLRVGGRTSINSDGFWEVDTWAGAEGTVHRLDVLAYTDPPNPARRYPYRLWKEPASPTGWRMEKLPLRVT